jgi:hypothetical protein
MQNFFKMAELKLKYGIILVDDEDYERVAQLSWRIMTDWRGYRRVVSGRKAIPLGRFILGLHPDDKRIADHENGNTLDNRRTNLRAVSRGENNLNSSRSRNASLISRNTSSYMVRAGQSGCIYIGSYKTKEEALAAAKRYKQAREK